MSRKKITIELTEFEAETLRLILGNVYVDQLLPGMSHSQSLAMYRVQRQLFAKQRERLTSS